MKSLLVLALSAICVAAWGEGRAVEIDRGTAWCSSYWGYSTPKIVGDGKAWYTAGIWGMDPETAVGALYKFDGAKWQKGAELKGIYQPATLALDSQGRVIVAYNQQGRPMVLKRSVAPGDIDQLEDLPAPASHAVGYYLGLAFREEVLYLAWIDGESYTMYSASLDLSRLEWTEPVVVQEGQVANKPKTAWTYPILYPDASGLHLVATNSPDGGDGNTYNAVWYLFYPQGEREPSIRERVAEGPVGHMTYAMDAVALPDGTVHVVYLEHVRKYGDPLPAGVEPCTTHAWRDPKTGQWQSERLSPQALASFYEAADGLKVVTQEAGTLMVRQWQPDAKRWIEPVTLIEASAVPAPPTFLDVVSRASGSKIETGLAAVTDGLLPATGDQPATHVPWAWLP